MEKFISAVASTEALAAFLGAFAAFLLEATRRWRSDRLAELAAGNEAVFAIAQMYTLVTNINEQLFVDRVAEVKQLLGRPPNYVEFLPMFVDKTDSIRLRIDKLGFLLDTYDPDILRRIASVDGDFAVLIGTLEQRNRDHVEWQQRSAQVMTTLFAAQPPTVAQMEQAVGMDFSLRLRALTEHLQEGLPRCAENLKSAGDQLTKVLAMTFPTRQITSFVHARRANAVTPHADVKPRLWRRFVRACYRIGRIQIGRPHKRHPRMAEEVEQTRPTEST